MYANAHQAHHAPSALTVAVPCARMCVDTRSAVTNLRQAQRRACARATLVRAHARVCMRLCARVYVCVRARRACVSGQFCADRQGSAHRTFASIAGKLAAKFSLSALACQRSFVPARTDGNPGERLE